MFRWFKEGIAMVKGGVLVVNKGVLILNVGAFFLLFPAVLACDTYSIP